MSDAEQIAADTLMKRSGCGTECGDDACEDCQADATAIVAALREANMLREVPDVPTGAPIDSIGVSGVPEQEVNEFLTDVRRPDVATMLAVLICHHGSIRLTMSDTVPGRWLCWTSDGYHKASSPDEAVTAAYAALPTETNP